MFKRRKEVDVLILERIFEESNGKKPIWRENVTIGQYLWYEVLHLLAWHSNLVNHYLVVMNLVLLYNIGACYSMKIVLTS